MAKFDFYSIGKLLRIAFVALFFVITPHDSASAIQEIDKTNDREVTETESAESAKGNPSLEVSYKNSIIKLLDVPYGLDERPDSKDNPLSQAKAELGKRLFFDTALSRDGSVSCATCHDPERGFASADPIAIGIDDRLGKRNAPSLLNSVYGKSHFWDGRVATLEEQALLPIENPDEMGNRFEDVLAYLRTDSESVALFANAFSDAAAEEKAGANKDDPKVYVTKQNVAKALAAFQRTLLIGNAPVDRFQNGEYSALTDEERSGMWLFESSGKCWKCHSGRNFTDEEFHNTGVSFGTKNRDEGRFEATGKASDRFAFKTPTLRGVELTAPYMHDGSIKTLEEVVRFYSKGGSREDKLLDPKLEKLDLTEEQISQLVAFLKSLSR